MTEPTTHPADDNDDDKSQSLTFEQTLSVWEAFAQEFWGF